MKIRDGQVTAMPLCEHTEHTFSITLVMEDQGDPIPYMAIMLDITGHPLFDGDVNGFGSTIENAVVAAFENSDCS